MSPPAFHAEQLAQWPRRRKIATMAELQKSLRTNGGVQEPLLQLVRQALSRVPADGLVVLRSRRSRTPGMRRSWNAGVRS